MLAVEDRRRCIPQQFGQNRLAVEQGGGTQVETVQIQKIERVIGKAVGSARPEVALQRMKIRLPVLAGTITSPSMMALYVLRCHAARARVSNRSVQSCPGRVNSWTRPS